MSLPDGTIRSSRQSTARLTLKKMLPMSAPCVRSAKSLSSVRTPVLGWTRYSADPIVMSGGTVPMTRVPSSSTTRLWISDAAPGPPCEASARLLGYAEPATERTWGMPRHADSRDAARADLALRLDPVRLQVLYAEGAGLSPEAVCALTLARE